MAVNHRSLDSRGSTPWPSTKIRSGELARLLGSFAKRREPERCLCFEYTSLRQFSRYRCVGRRLVSKTRTVTPKKGQGFDSSICCQNALLSQLEEEVGSNPKGYD